MAELTGTEAAEFLMGTAGDDQIRGLGGGDFLQGNAGNDLVDGGAGNDIIDGGSGNDELHGGEGDDRLFDNAGVNLLHGEAGNDQFQINGGSSTVYGGDGRDVVQVVNGASATFYGGDDASNDSAFAQSATLNLQDLVGNNDVVGLSSSIQVTFGTGDDRVTIQGGSVSGSTGDGADRIEAQNAGSVSIDAGSGNDSIAVGFGSGMTSILAGDGNDNISGFQRSGIQADGGNGNDRFSFVTTGAVNLNGRAGADLFLMQQATGLISGGDDDDDFRLTDSQLTVSGGKGADVFSFVSGSSIVTDFNPAEGDRLEFGDLLAKLSNYAGGTPFYSHVRLVQSGSDTLVQVDIDGIGTGKTFQTVATLQSVIASSLTAASLGGYDPAAQLLVLPGSGQPTDDTLTGSASDELIDGSDGDDTIIGNGGYDTLIGSGGNDTILGGALGDVIAGGAGMDQLSSGGGNDVVGGDEGNDTVAAGAGNDRLYGGALSAAAAADPAEFDRLDYSAAAARVDVNLGGGIASDGEGGNDSFIDFEGVVGSGFDDVVSWSPNTSQSRSTSFGVDGRAGSDLLQASDLDQVSLTGAADGSAQLRAVSNAGVWRTVETVEVEAYALVVRYDFRTVTVSGTFAAGTTVAVDATFASQTRLDASLLTGGASLTYVGGRYPDTVLAPASGSDDSFDADGPEPSSLQFDAIDYGASLAGVTVDLKLGMASGADIGTDTIRNFEIVRGSAAADVLIGGDGDDRLEGRGGDDRLSGGLGNDSLIGGGGIDTAVYLGNFAEYSVSSTWVNGPEGSDSLADISFILFADGSYSVANGTFTPTGGSDVSGMVADGYLSGATVFLDINGNRLLDEGEASDLSDETGFFSIPGGGNGVLVAVGGINIDTGLPNEVTFLAPAGAAIINPLTTIVQALIAAGANVADASAQVAAAIGLAAETDLLSFDPLAHPGDPEALAAQKAAAQIVELLVAAQELPGADGGSALTALSATFAAATAPLLLADPALITALLAAAAPGADVTAAVEAVTVANASIAAATSIGEISTIQGDVTAPDAPTNLANAGVGGGYLNAANNSAINAMTGKAEPGALITVYDGQTKLGTTLAGTDGAWSYLLGSLGEGAHSFTATASDSAGNVGLASSALAFVVDTLAPNPPAVALSTDTGASGIDRITSNASIAVVPGESGGLLRYSVDGGDFQSSYNPALLGDGQHIVTVRQSDAAGNVSAAATLSITLDRTAPAPAMRSYAADSGASMLSGTSEVGSVVKVFEGSKLLGTATADAGGKWMLSIAPLSSASHALKLQATDVAGNVGDSLGDILLGTGNNDLISGRATGDFLWGGAGNDLLNGGAGDDRLTGGRGNDVLTGGAGADVFVFEAGFGKDVVRDFQVGSDRLEISRSLFTAGWSDSEIYGYVMSHSQMIGGVLVLDLGKDSISLQGLNAASLSQGSFIFA